MSDFSRYLAKQPCYACRQRSKSVVSPTWRRRTVRFGPVSRGDVRIASSPLLLWALSFRDYQMQGLARFEYG